jgi:hypothetical protein
MVTDILAHPLKSTGTGKKAEQFGVLIEFDSTDQLMAAASRVRDKGYTRWDCYTPFPVHGLDGAMGVRPTVLPLLVFCFGLTGVCVALLMQWWMNGVDYAFLISNKPYESPWRSLPPYVPIMFELMVLFSAFGAVGTMFAMNGLPRFYHPLFNSKSFARVTNDRFFICLESGDPSFKLEESEAFAETLGGIRVETVPVHPGGISPPEKGASRGGHH